MSKRKYSNLYTLFIALAVVLIATSCEQRLTSREYEEIVTASSVENQMHDHSHDDGDDPHGSMNDLPPDHPDISSSMNDLPPDHPDISSSMQIPAGQDSPELQRALDASVARPPLSWKAPNGWIEKKGSGMRLATFQTKNKSNPIECSIISLGGQAGGLQPNVIRWMRQINISAPSGDQLDNFLSKQKTVKSVGNFPVTIIDLTELTGGEETPSMIAAIAEHQNMTIFIKMTGSKKGVVANQKQFTLLVKSLDL